MVLKQANSSLHSKHAGWVLELKVKVAILVVDCIEQTPRKLLLSTCAAWQGGSILGSRGGKSGSGGERREFVQLCCTERHSCVSKGGGCCYRERCPLRGHMPRGEASPSPLAACAPTRRAETFRGVCRPPTNQRPRTKSRGTFPPMASSQLPTSWGPPDAITALALAATRRTRKKATLSTGETFQLC